MPRPKLNVPAIKRIVGKFQELNTSHGIHITGKCSGNKMRTVGQLDPPVADLDQLHLQHHHHKRPRK